MSWIKRNLFLIGGIVVSLLLLGGAGFFLFTQFQRDQQIATQLRAQRDELQGYMTMKPFPSDENIAAGRAESQRLQQWVTNVQSRFSVQTAQGLDNLGFKSLLENSIAELRREAESSGVLTPSRYDFTFAAQRPMVDFPTNSIDLLTVQLQDIKAICGILFQSRVHSLDSLKRARVYAEEPAGGADYYEGKAVVVQTNLYTLFPYELTFKGFSSELEEVMNGILKSTNFFVVKKVRVAQAPAPASAESAAAPPPAAPASAGAATNAASTLTTVLDEKPLRVTLSIESLKFQQPGK